jgi:hypothetical protein
VDCLASCDARQSKVGCPLPSGSIARGRYPLYRFVNSLISLKVNKLQFATTLRILSYVIYNKIGHNSGNIELSNQWFSLSYYIVSKEILLENQEKF